MKKLSIVSVILFAMLLIGCSNMSRGSCTSVMSTEKNTSSKMSMSYKKFNGYKERDITVKENEEKVVTIDVKTKDGELDIYIAKDNEKENAVFEESNIETSTNTVTLTEPGTYTMHVQGEKHSGSYKFSWK